jgi:hypothetical protein
MALQSGFVLAVIIAALLGAQHLGGTPEVAKRLFQLALAIAISFAIFSGTQAFIRNPSYEAAEAVFDSSSDDDEEREVLEDFADRATLRRIIQFSAGVVAVIVGLSFLRRLPATSLATILGGVILVLFGGFLDASQDGASDSYLTIYLGIAASVATQSSRLVDIAEFIVLAAGALALAFIGLRTWDIERDSGEAPPADTAPA